MSLGWLDFKGLLAQGLPSSFSFWQGIKLSGHAFFLADSRGHGATAGCHSECHGKKLREVGFSTSHVAGFLSLGARFLFFFFFFSFSTLLVMK